MDTKMNHHNRTAPYGLCHQVLRHTPAGSAPRENIRHRTIQKPQKGPPREAPSVRDQHDFLGLQTINIEEQWW